MRPARSRRALLVLLVPLIVGLPVGGPVAADPLPVVGQDHTVDPVVLTGASFRTWSGGPEITFRRPQVAQATPANPSDCEDEAGNEHDPSTDHSCNQEPDARFAPGNGVPVDGLLGYRWTGSGFEQIPFQVDEKFVRYLSNNRSDFAIYSGVDQHTTYAWDREGFRYTDDDPSNPCLATPRNGLVAQPDPVEGLDDNDELVFMWRDAAGQAPASAELPAQIADMRQVTVVDPTNPLDVRYVYVALREAAGPDPAYTAQTGYVRYERDADADVYHFSESSYEGYGAAPQGPYYDPATGRCVLSPIIQRRPLDTAWVTTDTYKFRYDGRWLMTQLLVRQPDGSYGPDLIDRWKARAFQQDPDSETPCCGYEEEDTNWGGSSILMGERSGAVRTIRETWGADSGTNVIRREVFYRDQIQYQTYLRVHVIPPLDGIYQQWDYNANRITRYYNPQRPAGVKVDGMNDEVFGNFDDPCTAKWDGTHTHDVLTPTYREAYRTAGLCGLPYHQSVDLLDPTHSAVNSALQWEQLAGPYGSIVTRSALNEVTAGGAVQSIFAVPYYRDDACFDDGTGTDPGPRLRPRSNNEPTTYVNPANPGGTVRPRRCWTDSAGTPNPAFAPQGDIRVFQGSIGSHGLHLLFVAESDNASLTVPLTEIDGVQRQVILRGEQPNVGERYGRWIEFPLVALVGALPVGMTPVPAG